MIPQLEQIQEWTVSGSPVGLGLLTIASRYVLRGLDFRFRRSVLKAFNSLLPSILTLGIRFGLPSGVSKLAWLQKPLTKSRAERMQIAWLFATLLAGSFCLFTVANLLFSILGNRLASVTSVKDAVSGTLDSASKGLQTGDAAEQVFDGYIIASRYWLTWLPTTLVGSVFGHLQMCVETIPPSGAYTS